MPVAAVAGSRRADKAVLSGGGTPAWVGATEDEGYGNEPARNNGAGDGIKAAGDRYQRFKHQGKGGAGPVSAAPGTRGG